MLKNIRTISVTFARVPIEGGTVGGTVAFVGKLVGDSVGDMVGFFERGHDGSVNCGMSVEGFAVVGLSAQLAKILDYLLGRGQL